LQSQIINEFEKEQDKIRFNQGDILTNLTVASFGYDAENHEDTVELIKLDYALVINQDCDLEQDYNVVISNSSNRDKYLSNILVLPAYLEETFKSGKHREGNIQTEPLPSNIYKTVSKNNHIRYHFIQQNQNLQVPNLIIDFKHLYSVNRDYLYRVMMQVYLVSICEVFRENISHRYSHYLSRVGLPDRET